MGEIISISSFAVSVTSLGHRIVASMGSIATGCTEMRSRMGCFRGIRVRGAGEERTGESDIVETLNPLTFREWRGARAEGEDEMLEARRVALAK